MAKLEINAITSHFRGKIGDVIFRRRGDRLITALRPRPSEFEPTDGMVAARRTFRKAIEYAKDALADPSVRVVYERAAETKEDVTAFNMAVADYFKPPTVEAIDVAHYTGHTGDKLGIEAQDDVEVVKVHVVIKASNGTVLEQGDAAVVNRKWFYTATTTLTAGQSATIEATATDRPNHTGSMSVAFTMPG